jgi:hypothetical protein
MMMCRISPPRRSTREGLSPSERSKINHPSAILRRWKKDTEPQEEERDVARRHAEDLRALLGL